MELFSNASGLALIALFCLQQPWRGRGGNEGELAVLLVHSGDLAELGWFNSSGTLLAVRLASDDIRSDGSLLADRKPVLLVSKLLPLRVVRFSRRVVRLGISIYCV